MKSLEQQIEALLFWKQEPMTTRQIASFLGVPHNEDITKSLEAIKVRYDSTQSGITLIQSEQEYMLVVHECLSEKIQAEEKDDKTRDLSKVALETLSLITYRGPITRSEIDYVRGVNSQFILRNLLIRGLIEKSHKKNNDAIFVYTPSVELLRLLGITNREDMKDYKQVNEDVTAFMEQQEDELAEDTKDDKLHSNNAETNESTSKDN